MEPPAPPPPVAMPPTMGKHPPLATIAVPTGLAPHAWEAYAAADPRAEGGTCEGCKVSKVRCDRKRPCSRCVRLQHTCRPARKRPRPGTAAAAAAADNGADGVAAIPNKKAKAGGGRDGLSRGEQLVETVSGRELAEAMVQAVGRLVQDGRIDRERARGTLRLWGLEILHRGADVTWGAFEAIAAVLGFPIAELEVEATPAMGDETVDNSGTGGGGCIHGEEKATGAEKREQMHESSWWRMSRLPVTATGPQSAALLAENVPTFRQLDDDSHHHEEEGGLGGGGEAVEKGKEEAASANAAAGAAAAAGGEGSVALVALVCDGARQAVGVNAHFAHAYAPGPTWRAAGEQARLLPAFQLAALIVPGDYEEYFDALADVLFGPAFHATALLKALDGRLKPHLALLRVSLLPFPEVGRMAEVVSLRRAPASKHLREQAGLRPGSVLAVAAAAVGSGAAAAVAPCGAGAGKQQQPPPQNGQPRRRVGKKGGPQQQQPPPPPPMPQVLAMISPPSPPPPPLLSPSPPPLPPIPQEPHAAGPGKTNAGGDATAAAGEPPASSLPPQSMEPAGEQARVKGPLQQLLQRSTAPPLLPPQGLTPPPQLSPPSPQQPFAGPLIAAATNAGLPVAAAEAVAVVAISGPRGVAGVRHTHHDTSPLSAALGGMTHPSAPAPADAGHPQQSGPSRAAAAPSGQQQEPQHDGSGPAAAAGSTAPWIQKI